MKNDRAVTSMFLGALVAAFGISGAAMAQETAREPLSKAVSTNELSQIRELTLEQCLEEALQASHRRPASKFAVAMAEAQHRQALAGYWPQLSVKGAFLRMDEAPNFVFPAGGMSIPAQSIAVPGGAAMVTIPAGAFGNPVPIQLPVSYPGQTINVPAQQFAIPEQNVKLMDPQSFIGSVNATWLLYDGGMRKGYREQAKGWLDVVKQEARRTDLEIVDGVKRLYYGGVLALQIQQVGNDTLARMEATLDAMNAAVENRDLNTRAYQNELVETEKVIRAQLMEALMCAQHYKTRYDHIALQSQLNLLVGTEVMKQLKIQP